MLGRAKEGPAVKSTNNPFQLTHRGVLVTYDFASNTWKFTLRGRDRSAESALKAIEFIDKPVKQAKPFQKQNAFYSPWSNGENMEAVQVTSVAEAPRWPARQQVWILKPSQKGTKPERVKVSVHQLFAGTENNRITIVELQRLENEKNALIARMNSLFSGLAPFQLPKDEEVTE